MDVDALLRHRAERDHFLAEHYASPLPEAHRDTFKGLDYFPPEADRVITGTYQPGEQPVVCLRRRVRLPAFRA